MYPDPTASVLRSEKDCSNEQHSTFASGKLKLGQCTAELGQSNRAARTPRRGDRQTQQALFIRQRLCPDMAHQDAVDTAREYFDTARSKLWKLSRHTGKAAWIAGTSFLVLVVPLIIEMDREQQMLEFENQQIGALTAK